MFLAINYLGIRMTYHAKINVKCHRAICTEGHSGLVILGKIGSNFFTILVCTTAFRFGIHYRDHFFYWGELFDNFAVSSFIFKQVLVNLGVS